MKPGGETTLPEFSDLPVDISTMPIKIVHVTHSMEIGGTEQVIMQLVRGLDRNKFTNVIACIDGAVGEMGKILERENFQIHSFSRAAGFDRNLIRQLRDFLKTEQVDIVHCHQYTPYCYGTLAAIGLPAKVVFTEHGRFYPDSFSWKRRVVNQFLARTTDAIVSISEATRQALINFEWLPGKRISVIYNGMTLDMEAANAELAREQINAIQAGFLQAGDVLLGTVARLDTIKNHPMMIRSIGRLHEKHPNCRLVIVGDGPERENLQQLVENHGLQKAVLFTGFKNNTPDYISSFDIFLLTSDSEGTSMTLLEAMAFATPCVVTAVGGNPELIQHDQNGLLVQRDSDDELVAAIERLLDDQELCTSLGLNAQSDFESRFELRHMISGYGKLYSRFFGG